LKHGWSAAELQEGLGASGEKIATIRARRGSITFVVYSDEHKFARSESNLGLMAESGQTVPGPTAEFKRELYELT
jgi:uncharacterized protein (DUF2141 family)